MKNLFTILILLLISSCTLIKPKITDPLKNVSVEGISFVGTDLYYQGELCAKLSAVEVSLDDGKITREATFIITDQRYDDIVINIIKFVKINHSVFDEVEVELNYGELLINNK